jgi:GT2 family glycosyltransferase
MGADTQAGLPPTSLIIGSRNRPQFLLDTVESVLQGDEVPTELILIDQSDAPHPSLATLKHNRACELRYLWTPSVGVSRARNTGAAAAQHAILVGIDDDMFVPSRWFGTLVRALVNAGPRAIVTGKVLPTAPQVPGGFAPTVVMREAAAIYEGRIGMDVLPSCHMALYRSAFEEVGGFDERLGPGAPFPSADDNDFGFRLLEAGYRIVYVPEAVVYHRAWRSEGDYLRMRWIYGRGKGGYYGKYLSLRDRYMLRRMAWDIGHRIFGFPVRLWRHPRLAYGDPVYIFGILCALVQWLLLQPRTR